MIRFLQLAFLALLGFMPISAQIVINEVFYHTPSGSEVAVEIKNFTWEQTIDLSGWWLCTPTQCGQLGAGLSLDMNEIAVIKPSVSGSDSSNLWYLQNQVQLGLTQGAVALFADNDFTNPASIRAFVQWGAANSIHADLAVRAGIWQSRNQFLPTVDEGTSIAYDESEFSFELPRNAGEWKELLRPNIGLENGICQIFIKNQPESETTCYLSGSWLWFDIYAGVYPSLQWRRNGQDIPGATSSLLDLGELPLSSRSGDFDCVATTACGTVISNVARIIILPRPEIIRHPSDLVGCVGGMVAFTPEVRVEAGIQFQWFFNGAPLQGATQPSLTISPITQASVGDYFIRCSSACGTMDSQSAHLRMEEPLEIVQQPQDVYTCLGESVRLTVESNVRAVYHEWRKDGQSFSFTSGPLLELGPVTEELLGSYDCLLINSCGGITTKSARVALSEPIQLLAQSGDQLACEGNSLEFSVVSESNDQQFQWYHNQMEIAGATSATLRLEQLESGAAGEYLCAIWNACYQTESEPIQLELLAQSYSEAHLPYWLTPTCDFVLTPLLDVGDLVYLVNQANGMAP